MRKFISALALISVLFFSCRQRTQQADPESVEPSADTTAAVKAAAKLPEEPVFDIITNMGTIKVKLYKDTPRHRANFEKLAMSGYYDSLLIHRSVKGFVIQGGDPFTKDTALTHLWGQGGPGYTIPAEMTGPDGAPLHRHKKGALAAARRWGEQANPFKESSGSQFYLVQDPDNCVHLDGEFTVFGETVAGFNVIDKIASLPTDRADRPLREVRIKTIKPDEELNVRAAAE
ncbi:MAG: peptidylprolyl isomerase [Bacteroidales bacterium]|nr:peptidylprolyl isomerase [Bacteroidales bacterium]